MKKSKKNKIGQYLKSKQRESAIEQGFFDGRFKTKVVPDAKKKDSKESCKKWKY